MESLIKVSVWKITGNVSTFLSQVDKPCIEYLFQTPYGFKNNIWIAPMFIAEREIPEKTAEDEKKGKKAIPSLCISIPAFLPVPLLRSFPL